MNGPMIFLGAALSWTIAQVIKAVRLAGKRGRRLSSKDWLNSLTEPGGMPSGHSASATGLAMTTGLLEGFDSVYFALALAMAVVTIYDAVNVRKAVGEIGEFLVENKSAQMKQAPKIVRGHRLSEALAGILIGVMVSALMYLIVKIW